MQFEGTGNLGPEAMTKVRRSDGSANLVANRACFACTIGCQRASKMEPNHFAIKDRDRYKKVSGGLEYESAYSLGPMVGVDDIEAATFANFVCNEDGMDPISFGATVAAAMELYEEGAITDAETGGVAYTFGSAEALCRAAEDAGTGTGFGQDLGLGAKRLCEKYGRPELAMVAKGQEFPGYDGRSMQGMGLAYRHQQPRRLPPARRPLRGRFLGRQAGRQGEDREGQPGFERGHRFGRHLRLPDDDLGARRGRQHGRRRLRGRVVRGPAERDRRAHLEHGAPVQPRRRQ